VLSRACHDTLYYALAALFAFLRAMLPAHVMFADIYYYDFILMLFDISFHYFSLHVALFLHAYVFFITVMPSPRHSAGPFLLLFHGVPPVLCR